MFTLKNRFINQKKEIIDNFEANFERESSKLSNDEKNKLISLSEQIQKEVSKGMIVGMIISAFFYINIRPIKKFPKSKKILFLAVPLLMTPTWYFLTFMEKFKTFELYLALKTI